MSIVGDMCLIYVQETSTEKNNRNPWVSRSDTFQHDLQWWILHIYMFIGRYFKTNVRLEVPKAKILIYKGSMQCRCLCKASILPKSADFMRMCPSNVVTTCLYIMHGEANKHANINIHQQCIVRCEDIYSSHRFVNM